jgi:hypothetical protein
MEIKITVGQINKAVQTAIMAAKAGQITPLIPANLGLNEGEQLDGTSQLLFRHVLSSTFQTVPLISFGLSAYCVGQLADRSALLLVNDTWYDRLIYAISPADQGAELNI